MLRPAAVWRRAWCAAAALILGGVASAHAQDGELRLDLAYGPDPAERLDLCLPAPGSASGAGVVLIHGGGWTGGSRRDPLGLCKAFARDGLVVANIDYRLANVPQGAWPAQLQDVQLATRWLRGHAAGLGLDPARICAFGNSAGAHLAVFLAVLHRTADGDRAADLPTVSSQVSCAVDNFGPVDLTIASPFRGVVRRLAASDDAQRGELIARQASPLPLVTAATAPMMVVQGDDDVNVPPSQSAALEGALQRAHVHHVYLTYPGGHEFKDLPPAQRQAVLQLEAAFMISARPLSP